MPQKRADFENDRLLTRYLEPLAAWLERLGGDGDPGLLEALWRVALENHPHDSICGCSIDAVHDQMDGRFQRVRDMANAHLAQVTAELACRIAPVPGEGTPISVWNPHGTGAAEALGVVELPRELSEGEHPALVASDGAGRVRALHARVVRASQRYADYALPARVAAQLVRGFPPEFFGDPVCHASRRPVGETDLVEIWLGERPPPGFDWEARRSQLAAELEGEGDRLTHFRPQRLPAIELRLADVFPGAGLRCYRVREARGEPLVHASVRAESGSAGLSLENETLRLEVSRDGRVGVRHAPTGSTVEDFLRLVSEGDRGDTYSFDPLPDATPVERPESVAIALGHCTPSRAEGVIDARYRLPAALCEDRSSRSPETVVLPIRIRIGLAAGLDRIDLRVECENSARDHRLRLLLRAPFAAERFEVESAFEVPERPTARADSAARRPAEAPSGATPQRRFATLLGSLRVLCVANRGLSEVAALEEGASSALAVTLLRATGWLSRDDLERRPGHAGPPLETPGAQVPGPHLGEVSVFLRTAGDRSHRSDALRHADPPLLFAGAGGGEAPLRDGARLLEIDDPELVLSAIEPLAEGGTGVRLYDTAGRPRQATIRWGGGGPGLERTDLRGRALPEAGEPGPELRLSVRAHEILSLRAR
jgi:hypothetical protein